MERDDLADVVDRYLGEVASALEMLPVLRWQIEQRHDLLSRKTMPGHITTSAIVVSPDLRQVLLIAHASIGRWLQPGGHYEPSEYFHLSAAREVTEETGLSDIILHPWHRHQRLDVPFAIDSQDVRGNASRGEVPHVHHDLQYHFIGDPTAKLIAQEEEVSAAEWKPTSSLDAICPKAARRIASLVTLG